MSDTESRQGDGGTDRFEDLAKGKSHGIVNEFWAFLSANKKWWLVPLLVVLVLVGALVVLSSTALAPFIYTLF